MCCILSDPEFKKKPKLHHKEVELKLSWRTQFWDVRKTEKGLMEGSFPDRKELTKFFDQNTKMII